ncbi:MAG: cysteine desulfurase family protein [Anaerolineaceae bacterium]|nr:cysteine desulfurase family protein [Anaerolineaceae bacterium]
MHGNSRRQIYLDHAASTPVDERVLDAMMPWFTQDFGNASSLHGPGRRAAQAIEDARETVARILHCQPNEIVFNSGGTEGDNHAIRGGAWSMRHAGRGAHLVSSPVEHSAVSETLARLSDVQGFTHTLMPVDRYGRTSVEAFRAACRDDTALASVMLANNEVGSLQPVAELARFARERGILFHTDAVQAAGQLPLNVDDLTVDLLNISGHKFYGPKGVGALYCRHGVLLESSQTGGSHEDGRRAGTHNTPLIVGLALALELAGQEREQHVSHFRRMRDLLIDQVLQRVPGAELSGHPVERLPGHASFVLDGIDSSTLLMHLDVNGVAASGGSACKTGNPEPSAVLLAMGYSERQAMAGLRLTVGRSTSEEDLEYTVDVLATSVEKLRRLAVMA